MLRTLLESNAPRQRRPVGTAASVAVHTLLIGGAIVATASANPGARGAAVSIVDTLVYVFPDRRSPSPTRTNTSEVRRQYGVPAPSRIPPLPIDIGDRSERPHVDIDIARFLGTDSISGGRILGPRAGSGGERLGGEGGDEPATIATVERPAAMIAPPHPRYPDRLRAAGVTGRVVVRLVVDTAGRVEPGSVVIRESSHDLFTQSVRAVLPSLRFTPAEVGRRKVRMLVELPFEFRLND